MFFRLHGERCGLVQPLFCAVVHLQGNTAFDAIIPGTVLAFLVMIVDRVGSRLCL